MTAPDPRLEEIEGRLSKATPGPWHQGRERNPLESAKEVYSEREPSPTSEDLCSAWHPEDAEFIAAAPADIAYLLAELRKRDEVIATVLAVCDNTDTETNEAQQSWLVETIRAAVADATGGERG